MKCYPFGLDDLPGEIWLPIPDYENYHGSNFGRIKSFKGSKQRILKPSITRYGYLQVFLSKKSKDKPFEIQRLVAQLFVPNPENKLEVNHKDGNKFNNHVSNLEWVTHSENMQHATRTGLFPSGEDSALAKLTNEQVLYIRENPLGLTTYGLAEMFDVERTTISNIQRGKTYKTAGGRIRKAQSQKYTPRIPDEVRAQIRQEYKPGVYGRGSYSLAKKYGVGSSTILRIIHEG